MTYVIPAARRLVEQVGIKDVEYGQPDGIGHVRSVTFPADVAKHLAPALETISDPRIKALDYKKGKPLTVTFVDSTAADFADDFPIDEVSAILNS